VKILTVLTYYHPHWTGLTVIAKSIAEGLAVRGHDVTVLTTRHDEKLAAREDVEGVHVIRVRSIGRLSRGVIAPALPLAAARLIGANDIVQIHTPLPESLVVAGLCRVRGRPLVMTHQGDLVMPAGLANQALEHTGTALLHATGRLATRITTLSADYGGHSTFLSPFLDKLDAIHPPVEIPPPGPGAATWRAELGLEGRPVVGFAGRWVEEKGFDFLLRAIPALARAEPDVHLVYAGEHRMVYEDFYERCRPLVDAHRDRVTFVGLIRDRRRLADFFGLCDVFALPSRTDAFGAVQVEAMLCGTPVVATDIPGAREPVRLTGMGRLVAPQEPEALAAGLLEVLRDPAAYTRSREEIRAVFDPERSIDRYEALLASLA